MQLERLDQLLRISREALLSGDFAQIDAVNEEIAAGLALLESPLENSVEMELLERIRLLASANAALLRAAKRGIEAARKDQRIDARDGFSTYDGNGLRQVPPGPDTSPRRF